LVALAEEKKRLESASDVLKTLNARLDATTASLLDVGLALKDKNDLRTRADQKRRDDTAVLADTNARLAACTALHRDLFPRIAAMNIEVPGNPSPTIEACDHRQQEVREWLQARIDAEAQKIGRVLQRATNAMQRFCDDYPLDTQEMDARIEASGDYAQLLARLRTDDLPRFEQKFKELLNENTIRDVANFQNQLARERAQIKERIADINTSLTGIDYNPGRYIVLEAIPSPDAEMRAFHADLRACTEGALTGSEDQQYSEAKFLQVKQIIERFRGREGLAELDRRWTRKVTDVRNDFVFAASERWKEDNSEYEHYSDSGGKSGGQKEKLAYTILAASLAYRFGLEAGAGRSRTFRFVAIDEAFGRGSDESATYGLRLFERLNLQLLVVTPLQKIHIIEPFVSSVGFVHSEDGRASMIRNLTIEEFRAERAERRNGSA
jgi:uncharacterized protein YPO0396